MSDLSIDEKAFRVMTGEWTTVRQVWKMVDCGAKSTTEKTLQRLWSAGRIERTSEPDPGDVVANAGAITPIRYRRRVASPG